MRKWGIVVLAIILFILSIISGFIVKSFLNFSKKEEQQNDMVLAIDEEEKSVDTSSVDTKVSPNAEVVLTQTYKRCGHTVTKREIAPREIVNLDKAKVQEYYSDWSIDEFSQSEIKLSRSVSGMCEEHYIVGVSDGYITISNKNDSGEYIFKGKTDIATQYLAEDDIHKLEDGIEIVGRENLNKFLEDFE